MNLYIPVYRHSFVSFVRADSMSFVRGKTPVQTFCSCRCNSKRRTDSVNYYNVSTTTAKKRTVGYYVSCGNRFVVVGYVTEGAGGERRRRKQSLFEEKKLKRNGVRTRGYRRRLNTNVHSRCDRRTRLNEVAENFLKTHSLGITRENDVVTERNARYRHKCVHYDKRPVNRPK